MQRLKVGIVKIIILNWILKNLTDKLFPKHIHDPNFEHEKGTVVDL
jgi:hypothetical protein